MYAIETENGNFVVKSALDSILIPALIVKTPLGWKVMSRSSSRKNSRTHSATPQQAAAKYYGKKVEFIHTQTVKTLANAMGVK